MNAREFEKRLLDLVFQTDLRITPHLVAYRLDIPFQEAREQLDRMAKQGVINLEMDEAGNVHYEVPGVERPREVRAQAKVVPKEGFGQWFEGPANERPIFIAAPPRRPMNWMLVPLLALGGLFVLPLFFTMMFLLFRGLFGVGFFFLMGFLVVRAMSAGARRAHWYGPRRGSSCRPDHRDYPY